jgi:hypothetical protein
MADLQGALGRIVTNSLMLKDALQRAKYEDDLAKVRDIIEEAEGRLSNISNATTEAAEALQRDGG